MNLFTPRVSVLFEVLDFFFKWAEMKFTIYK